MSPKTEAPEGAPANIAPGGSMPMDLTQSTIAQPAYRDTQVNLGIVAPYNNQMIPQVYGPMSSNDTPQKAQLRAEVNQLQNDMQYNLHAAHEFVRKNELHTDQKAEALLAAQTHRFEATAAMWEH